MPHLRIATFNLENLDDAVPGRNDPSLAARIEIMRPQLRRVDADILCLQEIHSQENDATRTLRALDQLLAGTQYADYARQTSLTTVGELYNERNLVTLSRVPFSSDAEIFRASDSPRPSYQVATADPVDDTADPVNWERPFLYSQIPADGGRTLHVVNLHMKSKIPSSIRGQKLDNFTWKSVSAWAEGSFISSMKRMGQALQVRLFVDQLFDEHGDNALIAICGDFNAEADEVPVEAICGHVEETGNPEHAARVLVPCENNIPDSSRFSLLHLGRGEMIDHIVVSRSLLAFFREAEIHNEALPDESGAFRVDVKFPESDHAAVIAVFDIDT